MASDDGRPDPDVLLARIKAQEQPALGCLRIYLGTALGVGNAYAELQEAHRRNGRGTDVVIGFVETHGRPRTVELIGDLFVMVGNLTAPRATAREVEAKLSRYRRDQVGAEPLALGDRITVTVDHRPIGRTLIRCGWRPGSLTSPREAEPS